MERAVTILLALLMLAGSAQAMTVSMKVGPLVKEAQAMIAAKNYKGAMAKLDQAEAVKVYADDETVINNFRQVIRVKTLVCHRGESSRVIGKMVEPCPKS
jgi:hypothetical protein